MLARRTHVCREHLADKYAWWCPDSKYISLHFSNVMPQEEYVEFKSWKDNPMQRF